MKLADRIEIPTPFGVGRVNCYVFSGDRLTVIDPGPATTEAYQNLERGLREYGHEIEEIERVLITHPHMDHFGLANRIAERSGAHVLAHADTVDNLSDPEAFFDLEQKFFRPFLLSMGLPEQLIDTVIGLPEAYSYLQESVEVDRELEEGDSVDAGVDLRVVHTPGHAPGSVCFVADDERVAFTGDHVLPGITPNPLLTLSPGTSNDRTRSLPDYIASLRKLGSVDVAIGYGGHREPIEDLHERIEEIDSHHQTRKERIADMLDEMGPLTAYDIMQKMFPDLPATEMFQGMSEVIGHLDLLEDESRTEITERDGVKHYELR